MNAESHAPTHGDAADRGSERDQGPGRSRLELPDAANELLATVRYVTADDGPLRVTSDTGDLSPWHEETLSGALERLEVIDHYLRGRVAFFAAAKDHGYGPFQEELELARAALATCRAAAKVVDALLERRLPTEREFVAMSIASKRIHPALEALEVTGRC
jgi:hypothetical protein